MNDSTAATLARAVDTEEPREQRARAAARIIRDARHYRWVGIYDVDDDDIVLIGDAGTSTGGALPVGERLHDQVLETRRAMVGTTDAIAPVLGAESAIVIGTIDVQIAAPAEFSLGDLEHLEDCAEAVRALYD
jgi:putative methionine-R-sulfoxide reductase with GAF domain